MVLLDHSIITWLLTCVCAPHCIKNPYVTAKLVEVLFVTSPSIQPNSVLQVSVSVIPCCIQNYSNLNRKTGKYLHEHILNYTTDYESRIGSNRSH